MRTIIISHNNDPVYAFFEPIVKWAWGKFGWDCKCYVTESVIDSQVIRLYAAKDFPADTLLMTSDIDMLPLSDYWNPNPHKITCYGRDLSDRHYPICYIAMKARRWEHVMGSETMESQIKKYGNYWLTDQDMITDKLIGCELNGTDRGINSTTGYPIGRIDRSAWDLSLQQPLRIDAHLLRPGYTDKNWPRIMDLIKECLNPSESEVEWLENYRTEWIKSHS